MRSLFTSRPFDGPAPQPMRKINDDDISLQTGKLQEMPVAAIRFAHNDQSERFGSSQNLEQRSILQLVVELLSGLKQLKEIPIFSVCQHEGRWYCRTGHRRLASLRLANRWAPGGFERVSVQAVEVDKIFLSGKHGRPKLTTHLNGQDCDGRWLMVRETGEAVGREAQGIGEYGSDLLALLV